MSDGDESSGRQELSFMVACFALWRWVLSSPACRQVFDLSWRRTGVHLGLSDEGNSDHRLSRRPAVANPTFWLFSYRKAMKRSVANLIVFCSDSTNQCEIINMKMKILFPISGKIHFFEFKIPTKYWFNNNLVRNSD